AGIRGRLHDDGSHGRLGPLLFRHAPVRKAAVRLFGLIWRATPAMEPKLLAEARANFEVVDAWIAEGVVDGPQLFASDFMLAPSLALLDYHVDLREEIRARPLGRLVERPLPDR